MITSDGTNTTMLVQPSGFTGYGNNGFGMGRYTSRRGYSRDDFTDRLREVMEEAPDEQTRQSIERMIQKMDRE